MAGKPGAIVAIDDQIVSIAMQGGAIEFGKIRTETGRKSSAAALVKSQGLAIGDRLESEAAKNPAAIAG